MGCKTHPENSQSMYPSKHALSAKQVGHITRNIITPSVSLKRKPPLLGTTATRKWSRHPLSLNRFLIFFQHAHGDKGFGVPGINDPVNEPTVAPITGYNNPAPNGYQKAPKFQSKVAWTAGQNKLADDAARRASKACPDKVLVRVLPETRVWQSLTCDRCEACYDSDPVLLYRLQCRRGNGSPSRYLQSSPI
ncbi:hypothetical protein FGLOB1_1730 [Fusarium globosum]|uniref:Uncharacterized protein n=1 Tax=Fusarium globosum TaxID=78864 RepID=A0A8H5YVR1_9HYPO|nr:hypothetical protein FGLOB1_1730 [Fusarium globosum]